MRRTLVLLSILASAVSWGQDRSIDKLEVFYDQGHIKRVYRRSARLLADPYYDYSTLPGFYRALATIRMGEDPRWVKNNVNDIVIATRHLERFHADEEFKHLQAAHGHEMIAAEKSLSKVVKTLKNKGYDDHAKSLRKVWDAVSEGVEPIVVLQALEPIDTVDTTDPEVAVKPEPSAESDLIVNARSLIGTPYKWAGVSPEQGFDCSGFTSYVYSKQGTTLPRRSSDQHASAKKVGRSQVKPGDLVFFGKGKVSHVGIVSQVEDGKVYMVHASTSKGVIESEILSDPYWSARLKSYGRVL